MSDGVVMMRTLDSTLIVSDSIKLCYSIVLLANLVRPKSNICPPLLAMIQDAKRFILYNRSRALLYPDTTLLIIDTNLLHTYTKPNVVNITVCAYSELNWSYSLNSILN
jgi:hypothetical protein